MKRALVVFRKELKEGVRDRRSLLSVLLYPLVGPCVVALTLTIVSERSDGAHPIRVPVVGIENAPGLVRFLEEHDVVVEAAPDKPEEAVRRGESEVVLRISPMFGAEFREGRPALLELIVDRSRQDPRGEAERLHGLLQAYSAGIGAGRLLAHGVSPEVSQPLALETVDLATPRQRAALVLGMIPVFLMLAAFIGGMNVATDATAGERERNSFEPLLLNPVPRLAVVLGKWLATSLFAFAALTLTLLFTVLTLAWIPQNLGVHLVLGPVQCAWVLLTATPLCLFFSALQLSVATFAKSFKEAQAYLSFLVFVPMLPGLLLSFKSIRTEWWGLLIPGFSQQLLIRDGMRGETLALTLLGVSALVTLGLTFMLLGVTARLFQKERIIFGR